MSYWNTYGDGITDSQLYQAAEQASEDLQLCELAEDALLWQDEEDGPFKLAGMLALAGSGDGATGKANNRER